MKKSILLLAIVLFLLPVAYCEEDTDWTTAPILMKAYEVTTEKLYLEWQGSAPVYQVYMDGSAVTTVNINSAVIPMKKGAHTIMVYPVNEIREADTNLSVGISIINVGGNLEFDLASLGLDPKRLVAGTPSDPLFIDYIASPIISGTPEILAAETDFDDRVLLSIADHFRADEYLVTIKKGNNTNYVKFNITDKNAEDLILSSNTTVSLILDQEYLVQQGCMIPELDEKYVFSVLLRKYATNYISGEKEMAVIQESKESKGYTYSPIAAWKTPPVITYASQTADGEITLQWDHDDGALGCEYSVLKINKALGIKTGEEQLGATTDHSFTIIDLMNGGYTVAVIPQYQGEKGLISDEANVEVKNDWVVAPSLSCEQIDTSSVKLSWTGSAGIETYHITVFAGNSDSLLRFIDLDYTKHEEFDVTAVVGDIEHTYQYDKEYNPETGMKLKFEIYGVRHTAEGTEQKSAVSSRTITIK